MKKIVICPIFCDTHYIEAQIENIINTIDPDYILYNEGCFPYGPEGSTPQWFLNKYTLDGKRGFDFDQLVEIIDNATVKYNTDIRLCMKNYEAKDASENYWNGCSNFDEFGIKVEKGDLIFPFEGDLFHLESDKYEIQEVCDRLEPDQGFKTRWIDYVGNQYYLQCEQISRKICVKYGTENFYKSVILRFQKQNYADLLFHNDKIISHHLAWMRPQKYLDMRYDQLNRNPEYWRMFNDGVQDILKAGKEKKNIRLRRCNMGRCFALPKYYEGPWPEAMKKHECWYEDSV